MPEKNKTNDNCPQVGLCADCLHARRIESARGSEFYLCERSKDDARFAKYPTLPVVECPGYECVGFS
jgi:hypothetical protein